MDGLTAAPVHGEVRALEDRGITKETCAQWGYQVGFAADNAPCHIANYRDKTGKLVGQKLRKADKKFSWTGAGSTLLYGMWQWGKGKHIVITEGEIDALTVSQCFQLKWPVVSLPNGVADADKVLAANYEYLNAFDNIVLMFDQDDKGREATEKAAAMLPLGKVKVAVLPSKDANATLLAQGAGAVTAAFWNAKPWRPDGIVSGSDFTLARLKKAAAQGYALPYPKLQDMVLGLRKGELTLLTAGPGIGKSTGARELAYHLHQAHGLSIGNVYLEENNEKTAQGYVAIDNNIPLGRLRFNPDILTEAQWNASMHKIVHQRMWFYDHFGSLDSANLLSKLRYLARVCKVDFIVLDHISIVTSGMESSSEGERKDIDILMTRLASLAQETGVGIVAIVHLKRAMGKTFSEGSQISLSDLRGSGSLEQLSDNVWGMERNQQAEGEERDFSILRVLKCRETGDTGPADTLIYNRATGRLQCAAVASL